MLSHTKSRARKSAQVPHSRFANVSGVRLHNLVAGKGDSVVPLHGYAETSHMGRPLIARLAGAHTAIAPELRGAVQSSTPADGYTKAEMAQDIHALVRKLGYEHIRIVGHDIGLMIAYPYAAQYPSGVNRIALMDAFLPGVAIGMAEPDLSAIYCSQNGFARVCSWVLVALFVLCALEGRP